MECGYELTDLTFKRWDAEKELTFKWSAFKNYSIYNGHLILHIQDIPYPYIIFDNNEENRENLEKVFEMAKSKLPVAGGVS